MDVRQDIRHLNIRNLSKIFLVTCLLLSACGKEAATEGFGIDSRGMEHLAVTSDEVQ